MKRHLWPTVGNTLMLASGIAMILYGCGGGGNGGGGGGGTTGKQTADLEAKKVASETEALTYLGKGDYYKVLCTSQFPNGSTGQVYAGEYNMTGSKNGISATMTMRAAYTSTDLYIQLEWDDATATNDLNRRRFLFNGPDEAGGTVSGWSSQLNDDKFALAFDIASAADGTGTFQTKGCVVGCHGSMNPTSGTMDVWHWKTSRSNPMGYVNDQFADSASRRNDAGDAIEVRNWKTSGAIAAGPGGYYDPTSGSQNVTLPNPSEGNITLDPALFLIKGNKIVLNGNADDGQALFASKCAGCHSPVSSWQSRFAARGLNQTDAQLQSYIAGGSHPGAGSTTGMTGTDWDNINARIRAFQGVPGYFLQVPTGSSADLVVLNSKTVYNNGKYTVRIRRSLLTNNPDDVQFDVATAKTYPFGVAVMDKDGKNHAGSSIQQLKFLN